MTIIEILFGMTKKGGPFQQILNKLDKLDKDHQKILDELEEVDAQLQVIKKQLDRIEAAVMQPPPGQLADFGWVESQPRKI